MKKLWKRILWIALGLGVVALLVMAFLPKPVQVETAAVTRGPMEMTLEAEGQTRIHDLFVIAAPVSGRLDRIDLEAGDIVQAGRAVATIRPAQLDALQRREVEGRIAAAEANMRQAAAGAERLAAALEQAGRERDRAAMLEGAGSLARQDRERAENASVETAKEFEAARYRAQAAAYEAAIARAGRLAYAGGSRTAVVLRAPASGRVLRVLERSERPVAAGTPILQLGDPAGLEVVVDVLSSDAVGIANGAEVRIIGWGGDSALRARVKYVEPAAFTKISALGVEEQRVNVIAELLEVPPRLGDGFRVDARIVLWSAPSVLKVPTSALFRNGGGRNGGGWSVFVVQDGKARQTAITLGKRNAFEAEVLGGLREGMRVIAHPSDNVADGVSVEPVKEPAP